MWQQVSRTRWEGTLWRKISCSDIWQAEPQWIKFMVHAVYNVLPNPANLHIWGQDNSPACLLCNKRGSHKHILSSCPVALGEGHYRWRHDQVLKIVAEAVAKAVNNNKQTSSQKNILFVNAGEQLKLQPKPASELLSSESDWDPGVDLGRQLKFPYYIMSTLLRPDMVLWLSLSKQVLLIVHWEDEMEEANERIKSKYQELVE